MTAVFLHFICFKGILKCTRGVLITEKHLGICGFVGSNHNQSVITVSARDF